MLRDKSNASPFGVTSQSRVGKPDTKSQGGDRRLKGLESIYLQKFDNKKGNRGQAP
jgi:hypothetical protein